LIGEMSEQELRNKAQFRQELVTAQQMVAVEFYVGIAAKRAGDESSYYAHLEACHKIPKMEDIYEHYLALFELSRKSKMKGPKPRSR